MVNLRPNRLDLKTLYETYGEKLTSKVLQSVELQQRIDEQTRLEATEEYRRQAYKSQDWITLRDGNNLQRSFTAYCNIQRKWATQNNVCHALGLSPNTYRKVRDANLRMFVSEFSELERGRKSQQRFEIAIDIINQLKVTSYQSI